MCVYTRKRACVPVCVGGLIPERTHRYLLALHNPLFGLARTIRLDAAALALLLELGFFLRRWP